MKRGRPFEPGNNFGRGRPRGSRNKKTAIIQELLDEHGPALIRKALLLAHQGDRRCLQMFLERILPRAKEAPVKTTRLRMGNSSELVQSIDQLGKDLAAGKITAEQARPLLLLIKTADEAIQNRKVDQRLRALEEYLGKGDDKGA